MLSVADTMRPLFLPLGRIHGLKLCYNDQAYSCPRDWRFSGPIEGTAEPEDGTEGLKGPSGAGERGSLGGLNA